jgi:hypothetical protein
VKPTVRSTSRISSKDASNSLAFDKLNRPRPLKEDSHNRIEEPHNCSPSDIKAKKRRISTNTNSKSTTSQKIESVSRPKKTNISQTSDKKKSLVLLRMPKQSPSCYEWCTFLSILDGVISEKDSGPTYKAFVGKGNNSILIKNVIKSRPWWILTQESTEVNFFWSQMKNPKFLESLKEGQTHG